MADQYVINLMHLQKNCKITNKTTKFKSSSKELNKLPYLILYSFQWLTIILISCSIENKNLWLTKNRKIGPDFPFKVYEMDIKSSYNSNIDIQFQ